MKIPVFNMRTTHLLTALTAAAGVWAADLVPFSRFDPVGSTDLVDRLLDHPVRRGDCSSSGFDTCGIGCLPTGYICCGSDGGTCPADTRCESDGCCPIGETCTGPGGTQTLFCTSSSAAAAYTATVGYGSSNYSAGPPATITKPPATTTRPVPSLGFGSATPTAANNLSSSGPGPRPSTVAASASSSGAAAITGGASTNSGVLNTVSGMVWAGVVAAGMALI